MNPNFRTDTLHQLTVVPLALLLWAFPCRYTTPSLATGIAQSKPATPPGDKPTAAAAARAGGADSVKWQPVPLRTAEQKAKGYAGGEMGQMGFTMAICPSDPNHLAIGIDTAAVYTSRDGGKSWQLRRRGIKSKGVQSVAFDPKNPRVLWAAGLRSAATTPQSGMPDKDELSKCSDPVADGIYRSADGGESWQLLRNAVFLRRQAQNEYFAFDPQSFDGKQHRTVYAATHGEGLLKTTDGGSTWQALGFPLTRLNAVLLHPLNPRLLFVAGDTGLFRSIDAGGRFEKLGTLPVFGLALDTRDLNKLFAVLGEKGIWRSNDGGRSFKPRMEGMSDTTKVKRWVRLCVSAVNPNFLYADANYTYGSFPFWSHNGGMSWSAPEQKEPGFLDLSWSSSEGFVAHPTDPNIAFHMYPVRKTTDGGRTWRYTSDGISGCRRATRTSIAFRAENPKKMVFFHIDHGSALTTDGGDTFIYCPPPHQQDLGRPIKAVSADDPTPAVAAGAVGADRTTWVGAYDPTPGSRKLISAVGRWREQRICISEDDGKTWSVQPETANNYRFMAFHRQNANIVYAGRTKDSLRSRDGGKTWQTLPHPIKAMFPGNGDIVFALYKGGQVLRSSDQGETWTPLPGWIVGSAVQEIDVDPSDSNRLYAAALGGVWFFDGKSWTKRDEQHGLEKDIFGGLNFNTIAVDPTRPNIIYAGQNHSLRGVARGIFRSTNSGEHWENISGNLGPDLTVWAITVSPHDGTVWLGTDYGNWKLAPTR